MTGVMKRAAAAFLAVTFAFGMVAATVSDAEAGRRGRVAAGVAAGIIGLGILGAAAEARDRGDYYERERCYPGPEECGYRERRCYENEYGDEVCRGGGYTCWRPTVCD
jgi:hypothetical protein